LEIVLPRATSFATRERTFVIPFACMNSRMTSKMTRSGERTIASLTDMFLLRGWLRLRVIMLLRERVWDVMNVIGGELGVVELSAHNVVFRHEKNIETIYLFCYFKFKN
jgi:hypothetical protein